MLPPESLLLNPARFELPREQLDQHGPIAAADALCQYLLEVRDYQNLFYARLLRSRIELGVSPFPTGPSTELPPELHDKYEDAIRNAGREAGQRYLEDNDIPRAWPFYRMLGEHEPVREALRRFEPALEDDVYPLIEIAWQNAVLPEKGFDLVLDRSGICSAITLVHSSDLNANPSLREYCIQRLVRSLYDQLRDRIRADLDAQGITTDPKTSIHQFLQQFPQLTADDAYHIDTSHLSSVAQLSMHLTQGEELTLARELCEYGSRLGEGLRGSNDPPFEETYSDYLKYLDVISGTDVEGGLEHFRQKVANSAAEGYRYPAEVLINLFVHLERYDEALDVASNHLADADERQLSCPGISTLARKIGDYERLSELAREKNDPVNYLASLIAARSRSVNE